MESNRSERRSDGITDEQKVFEQESLEISRAYDDRFVTVKKNRPLFAAACMISAVLFYASSLILIKIINIIEPGINPFAMLSIRSVMNLVLLTPVASA